MKIGINKKKIDINMIMEIFVMFDFFLLNWIYLIKELKRRRIFFFFWVFMFSL